LGKIAQFEGAAATGAVSKIDDFLRIRSQADPQGRFLNNHARAIFLG